MLHIWTKAGGKRLIAFPIKLPYLSYLLTFFVDCHLFDGRLTALLFQVFSLKT